MLPQQFLKQSILKVWPEVYAVIKAKQIQRDVFASIIDHQEITLIQTEKEINEDNIIEKEGGWKILTFDVKLPFELTGFLAVVATALAEEQISIFALSAYSTDHILVKEDHLQNAIEVLTKLGVKKVVWL